MSEEAKTEEQTNDNQPSNNFDDDSINKIIAEVEKDLESKNAKIEKTNKELVEKVYSNLKTKFDSKVQEELDAKNKEIESLKSKISDNTNKMDANKQATEEAVKKIVEEYQNRLTNIDNKLSQGNTQIDNQKNPFKNDPSKKVNKYDDLTTMDIPEEEKVKLFYKYVRGQ